MTIFRRTLVVEINSGVERYSELCHTSKLQRAHKTHHLRCLTGF